MITRRNVTVSNQPPSPEPVIGVFVLPNNTAEHDVFEVIRPSNAVFDFGTFFDIAAITKSNFRLRLYVKVDGANYRLHNTYTYAATEEVAQFDELHMCFSFKVTAQSSVTEGAPRNIPYAYAVDLR